MTHSSRPGKGVRLNRRIKRSIDRMRRSYVSGVHHFIRRIRAGSKALDFLALLASFLCLGCLAAHMGFDNSQSDIRHIRMLLRVTQGVFLANILYNLLLNFRDTRRNTLPLKWLIDIGVLVTLLPLLYPHPEHPWIPWLEKLLYGHIYLYAVLVLYATVEICKWVMRSFNRRTNPALMLSGSFLVFIIIGTGLLMLPNCTYYPISFVDSFFVSTSAVCITGLTTVDVSSVFTPLGCTVLAVLIQIGALGVLTFTSFFALFYTGGNSIYSQLMVKDLVYTRSFGELLPTLLYILCVTLFIEALGALLIWLSVRGELPMDGMDLVWFSVFHSISAFCNAGFSTIHGGMSNPLLLYGNQWIYLAMSLVITLGCIGFPILVNLKDVIVEKLRRLITGRPEIPVVHQWSMNSKLVLVTSAILLLVGAGVFLLCEYDNTLRGMSGWDKAAQTVFNTVTPRSAGFTSVSPASFMPVTLLVVMTLMWIGGASQSTAGGMKVNTFAAILLNLRAIITGKHRVTAFSRTISPESMQRVQAVLAISILTLVLYTITLIALEPDLPAKALIFEALSAVFTVGSSLGVTSELSGASKILLCSAMFFGRIGVISILMGFADTHRSNAFSYPSDNIIIN